ncbi:MAG TPA: site-specific integrase [Polyangia bacterium]|nr:site-specific integrase [Polyangia bacterium]
MGRRKRRRPPGQGTCWTQGGNTWIRWYQNARRRSKKFPGCDERTTKKAKAVLASIVLSLATGGPGEVDEAPTKTIGELAADWLKRRQHTHRAAQDDRNRWNRHIEPVLGQLRPGDVDQGTVRRLIERKLDEKLSPQSVGNIVRLLSTFFTDAIEQKHAKENPARALPRATRKLIKGTHDPKQTPFIERHGDIATVYSKLAQPFATIFAVGALAGLRPGEIVGLEWGDVDLAAGRILVQRQVRHGKVGPTKSGKPRLVPIVAALAPVLAEWKLATGGEGLLFKPLTPWRKRSIYIKDSTVREKLRDAFKASGLPETLTWYHASRHTYASQHVMGGGSLGTLREILGHSSVTVTERYAHLRPDLFKPEDLLKLSVGLSREGGEVVDLAAARAAKRSTDSHAGVTEGAGAEAETGLTK